MFFHRFAGLGGIPIGCAFWVESAQKEQVSRGSAKVNLPIIPQDPQNTWLTIDTLQERPSLKQDMIFPRLCYHTIIYLLGGQNNTRFFSL